MIKTIQNCTYDLKTNQKINFLKKTHKYGNGSNMQEDIFPRKVKYARGITFARRVILA